MKILSIKPNKICYCHDIFENEILEFLSSQPQVPPREIIESLRGKCLCDCENKHPEKRCCFPDIQRLINNY